MLKLADMGGVGCSDNIAWISHGRAFKILDEVKFMQSDVPMFFKQTKIRSFYRQLNLWGFKRVLNGADAGAWYNSFFLRGRPKEMNKLRRIKIKGKSIIQDFANHKDPPFYSLPPLPSVTPASLPRITEPHNSRVHRRVTLEGPRPGKLARRNRYSKPQELDISPVSMPMSAPSRCVSSQETSHYVVSPTSHKPTYVSTSPICSNDINQETSMNSFRPSSASRSHRVTPLADSVFSCDDEIKRKLKAGLFEPLPFHGTASPPFASTKRFKSMPFTDDNPLDDFASYIEAAIHSL